MLNLKNPLELKDPVFGLLGNGKASEALGKFQGGPDCLQQAVADQAFTNAKDSKDIEGVSYSKHSSRKLLTPVKWSR